MTIIVGVRQQCQADTRFLTKLRAQCETAGVRVEAAPKRWYVLLQGRSEAAVAEVRGWIGGQPSA